MEILADYDQVRIFASQTFASFSTQSSLNLDLAPSTALSSSVAFHDEERSAASHGEQVGSDGHDHVDVVAVERSILSPELYDQRRAFLKSFLTMVGLCTVVMWACLCLFWGTNSHVKELLPSLDVELVSFEQVGDRLNMSTAITDALQDPDLETELSHARRSLVYRQIDAAETFPRGVEQVMESVRRSGPWAAVVIGSNTTKQPQNAMETEIPKPLVEIYYSSVRSTQVVFGTLLPSLEKDLHRAVEQASRTVAAADVCNTTRESWSTAAAMLLTLNDVSWHMHDVNPIQDMALLPAFSTALIWLAVLTFLFAFVSHFARLSSGLTKATNLSALIKIRVLGAMLMYALLSLWYTCINLVFQVDIGRQFGTNGGFFALWALNFLTTCSIGLAMEAFLSLLTLRFFPFFLVTLIICNLSAVITPIQLMHRLYRFAYAMPFYQNVQGTKIIVFGNERDAMLARYFGVLVAWTGLLIGLLSVGQWVECRRLQGTQSSVSAHLEVEVVRGASTSSVKE